MTETSRLGDTMSFLKSINRQMERNQAASRALLAYYDKASLSELDEFKETLWSSIAASSSQTAVLEIVNTEQTSLDFIVKLFVKIGFSCEDAVRLMMQLHQHGKVVLARAEEPLLEELQAYINTQAKRHRCCISNEIIRYQNTELC